MSASRRPRLLPLALAIALAAALPAALASPAPASAAPAKAAATVDIPYEEFTLPNGLRVIVHTDRKAPIVAVNLWYHVGSKDEPAGRSGFAHLFEHLMFQASENHKGEYFEPFKQVGVTDQNGTTNQDRTNYFENVPTTALDTALWMESDRMGHLVGAIGQAELDEQRGVVQNEKRQGENQPYGRSYDALLKSIYPAGHPYHHTVIGSMNDLDAASLEDVKNWFRSWYGPNNAVLVLAGDIDLATAKEKVTRYFGDIPASATLPKKAPMIAARTSSTRETMTDRVAQTRVMRVWNVPNYASPDVEYLQLFAQVLGGSRSSRLDKRLFFGDKSVDRVSASMDASELGGTFDITADIKEGVDPAVVEKAANEELQRLLAEGPTQAELDQARTVFRAGFIRGIERIGGFGGKADALAECTIYTGNPGCFRDQLQRLATATPAQVKAAANRWLAKGDHTLSIVKGDVTPIKEEPAAAVAAGPIPKADPKYTTVASEVVRSTGVPVTTQFPDLVFPALQRATLSNGTKVILAERHDTPVVQLSMEFPGGFASDRGRKAGTASFAMNMLDEGAGSYDAIAFGNRQEQLGAALSASAGLDTAEVSLSALKENLEPSLALWADMIRRPRFDAAEIERVRANWLAGIEQEKTQPSMMGMRVIGPVLYGEGHPYAIPFTGTGYEADIKTLGRDELLAWTAEQLRPDTATVVIVGDTTLAEITPLLEKQFGDWKAPATAHPSSAIPAVALPSKPRVYIIDQPGAVQSNIIAAQLLPASTDAATVDLDFANLVLGGDFTSRLNMNLREDKHWSYGARSGAGNSLGQRLWTAQAPVQSDKTIESIKEMQKEIGDYAAGRRAIDDAEIARLQAISIRSLPGSYETARNVLSTIGSINRYGRPDDFVMWRKGKIEKMTPAGVQQVATGAFKPEAMTWIVIGDRAKIEAGIRALNIGEVTVLDADGKVVK
jgi:predicted Zn-dependent peptidase